MLWRSGIRNKWLAASTEASTGGRQGGGVLGAHTSVFARTAHRPDCKSSGFPANLRSPSGTQVLPPGVATHQKILPGGFLPTGHRNQVWHDTCPALRTGGPGLPTSELRAAALPAGPAPRPGPCAVHGGGSSLGHRGAIRTRAAAPDWLLPPTPSRRSTVILDAIYFNISFKISEPTEVTKQ